MQRTITLFLFFLFFISFSNYAQVVPLPCATDSYMKELKAKNPKLEQQQRLADSSWSSFINSPVGINDLRIINGNDTIYEIPLVFHILHTSSDAIGSANNPSDAQIVNYVNYLNQSYAATYASYVNVSNGGVNVPVRFVLAQRTPGCNPQPHNGIIRINVSTLLSSRPELAPYINNGIRRNSTVGITDSILKTISRWDPAFYYNIYSVNYIDGPTGGVGGYAYLPPNSANFEHDGTVILSRYTTPLSSIGNIYYNALPHELGHALGLYHTFQAPENVVCAPNTNCSNQGDRVCDTDPHPLITDRCPLGEVNTCLGTTFGNIVYNQMNYAPCYTLKRFTVGQKERMLYHLLTYRSSLISSLGGTPLTTMPFTAITPASCSPNANSGLGFGGLDMGITGVQIGNIKHVSGSYNTDGERKYIDFACNTTPFQITGGQNNVITVDISNLNTQWVQGWIDFNNDGVFSNSEVIFHDYSYQSSINKVISMPANYVTCVPLRLRIMSVFDLWYMGPNDVSACLDPGGGQVEDYAVIINPPIVTNVTASISSNQTTSICTGTAVTFTSNVSNLPTNATLRWYVNNSLVATGTSTYTSSSLTNGAQVRLRVSYPVTCSTRDSISSNVLTMQVSSNVTPSLSITNNSNNTVCQGANITFTAIASGGGTAPVYQWKVNGNNVGTNSATFSPNNLNNGDVVSCQMTSSLSCVTTATVNSNNMSITVLPVVTPSVVIATSNNNLCVSNSLTFTAAVTNGGSSPNYQWKRNGTNVGTNSATFTSNALAANDIITVVVTPNASCVSVPTATSNAITVVNNANVTPLVMVTNNVTNNTICPGQSITFTATPTYGGNAPVYQWKVNGVNVGSNSATYTTNTLANGDQVTVQMTSNATCIVTNVATSSPQTITVTPGLIPTVSINSANLNLCVNNTLAFTATTTNGGSNPSYQWKVNGNNVGGNSATYSASNLNANDVVTCQIISNASCLATNTATSNALTVTRVGNIVPTIAIASNVSNNTICAGSNITFTATAINGGTTPNYQWKVNGVNVGNNSSTFTTSSLTNGAVVTCQLTTNASCVTTNTVTSNGINVTVNPIITPSVSISAANLNLCVNNTLQFTATPVNGGTNPTYQWRVNGIVVSGVSGPSFSSSTLNSGDQVSVVLNSNAACVSANSATSNVLIVNRVGNLMPTISITSNKQNNAICSGESITFTASVTNGGTPNYQWKRNGINVGTNTPTFTASNLSNNDVITCVLTSNAICLITPTATSNAINVTVNPLLTPAVTITASHTNLCVNPNVTFTATPVNGGLSPTYQWKVNGVNVPSAGPVLNIATLQANDIVSVVMTTSIACYTTSTATSNNISVTKVGIVPPTINISSNVVNNTICQGQYILFTANITNGGNNPTYEWRVNGNVVGGNTSTYSSTMLNNNDVVTCRLVSNQECIATAPVTSNAVTVTVNPILTSSISIAPSVNNICEGTSVTFTATSVNAGPNPVYQWKVNGVNVGSNATSYTSNTFVNGDVVSCELFINDICVASNQVNSNTVQMDVVTNLVPAVTITSNRGTSFCNYDSITVQANVVNGGTTPTYEWKLNGVTLPMTSASINLGSLNNGDVLIASITSNERCLVTPYATSNVLAFDVTTSGPISLTPTDVNEICEFNIINIDVLNANGNISWFINDTLLVNRNTSSLAAFREGSYKAVNEINGCYDTSSITTIILDPMPAPILRFTNGAYEVDNIFDTYRWYFNDALVQNNNTHQHIPHAYGQFKVCVTKDGCNACTEPANYPDPLSVGNLFANNIKVYPNPTTGVIYIDYDKKINLEVRAMDGRVMKYAGDTKQIDISELASGAYMLYLIDPQTDYVMQTHKMFKD